MQVVYAYAGSLMKDARARSSTFALWHWEPSVTIQRGGTPPLAIVCVSRFGAATRRSRCR